MFNPKQIVHPYGISDPSKACKEFGSVKNEEQKWPAKNLIPMEETIKDGQIDASEFDSNLQRLSIQERDHLMKEVIRYPLIHSIG